MDGINHQRVIWWIEVVWGYFWHFEEWYRVAEYQIYKVVSWTIILLNILNPKSNCMYHLL
jgi:hypothetical protein